MQKVTPKARLAWIGVVLAGSAFYAVLIAYDPRVASAIALGYVAVLLTIFIVVEVWKKP